MNKLQFNTAGDDNLRAFFSQQSIIYDKLFFVRTTSMWGVVRISRLLETV